jgi:multisubunit Na+/H+ antiporter MnhG subunit
MALPFLFLGVIWIVNGIIGSLDANTRYERAIAISIVTLFYALPGTLVGAVTILLSLRERKLLRRSG